jgi:hypothetical protein
MPGTEKRIIHSVEIDQGGGRWLAILRSEDFEHTQAIAEDARAGGSKVRVVEERCDPGRSGRNSLRKAEPCPAVRRGTMLLRA